MIDAKMHQNAPISMLQFKKFPGAIPPNPHVGEGLRRPFSNPILSALRRCAPLAPRSGPQSSPNVC